MKYTVSIVLILVAFLIGFYTGGARAQRTSLSEETQAQQILLNKVEKLMVQKENFKNSFDYINNAIFKNVGVCEKDESTKTENKYFWNSCTLKNNTVARVLVFHPKYGTKGNIVPPPLSEIPVDDHPTAAPTPMICKPVVVMK